MKIHRFTAPSLRPQLPPQRPPRCARVAMALSKRRVGMESMHSEPAPAAALDASRTRQRAEQISPLLTQTSAATRPSASVSVTRMPRAKFALLASSGSGST